ncbi:MAG: hypothetical protein ACPG31_12900 [Planctomycetota bacterium]
MPYRHLWLRQLRAWLRRLPKGQLLGTPDEILEELQGALWLALQASGEATEATARQALRQVLYREFEASWAAQAFSFDESFDSPSTEAFTTVDALLTELPSGLRPIALRFLAGEGPEGVLQRGVRHFGSRRQVRLFNALLLQAILSDDPLRDLKRRCARLCVAVSQDGPLPSHRRQAKALKRALTMLEPNEEIRSLRQMLSGIAAARTPADPAGNPECANACTEPRATARGR